MVSRPREVRALPMPRDRALERLRGFHDSWIEDEERRIRLQEIILQVLHLHGYRRVDVPILEPTELFLRKNGAEMATKLYSFTDLGRREVALRPEFTASVLRGVAERNLEGVWPLRLSYCGPVFRYERPQWGTSRQFTQVGAEFLGAGTVASDVDLIRLACTATELAGLGAYRLVLGHLGIVTALLEHLALEPHIRQFIIANLEYYNRGSSQRDDIHERLGLTAEEAATTPDDLAPPLDMITDPAALPPSEPPDGIPEDGEAHDMLTRVLADLELNLTGSTRTPEEIVARLFRKAQRRDQRATIRQALEFVSRLGAIQGPPDAALAACGDLLREHGVRKAPLENLHAIVAGLDATGFDWSRGEISLGMARGIPYYTGMIFELYSEGSRPLQFCGGGRYDGLARTLAGGPDVPALGFAFRVERLLIAALDAGRAPVPAPPPVSVYATTETETVAAAAAAAALRDEGIAADLDPNPRSLRSALARARRLSYDIVVGVAEVPDPRGEGGAPDRVTLHHLGSGRRLPDLDRARLAAAVRDVREGSVMGAI
ncbi:MAG: ATP phosphoribosyltransferase regulatory subunit [Chloroflexota bacterium]